jgi:hypothetical protein
VKLDAANRAEIDEQAWLDMDPAAALAAKSKSVGPHLVVPVRRKQQKLQ